MVVPVIAPVQVVQDNLETVMVLVLVVVELRKKSIKIPQKKHLNVFAIMVPVSKNIKKWAHN